MGATYSQLFPPAPALTEKNISSQIGRVFLITGGTSGVGLELAKIVYNAGATVYITGRSESSISTALKNIKSLPAESSSTVGEVHGVILELSDLRNVKPFVDDFTSKVARLDVLWLNAGVSQPPMGSTSAQGHELQMAVNCLAPLLLSHLLLPSLKAASSASATPAFSTRVVWTSSQTVDLSAPKGGFEIKDIVDPPKDNVKNYVASKTGNWFLASQFARNAELSRHGILSLTQNPGNWKSNLLRDAPWMFYLSYPLLYPPKMGAYTELFAGLDESMGEEEQGGYVVPWGRVHPGARQDLLDALKSREQGGTGRAEEFWDWCEERIKEFR